VASPQPQPAPEAIAPLLTPKPAPKPYTLFTKHHAAFLAQMQPPPLLQPRLNPPLPTPTPASAVHWGTVRPLFTLPPTSAPSSPAPTWATARPGPALPGLEPPPLCDMSLNPNPEPGPHPPVSRMKTKASSTKNWVQHKPEPMPPGFWFRVRGGMSK
jgi:hypothetical protein